MWNCEIVTRRLDHSYLFIIPLWFIYVSDVASRRRIHMESSHWLLRVHCGMWIAHMRRTTCANTRRRVETQKITYFIFALNWDAIGPFPMYRYHFINDAGSRANECVKVTDSHFYVCEVFSRYTHNSPPPSPFHGHTRIYALLTLQKYNKYCQIFIFLESRLSTSPTLYHYIFTYTTILFLLCLLIPYAV